MNDGTAPLERMWSSAIAVELTGGDPGAYGLPHQLQGAPDHQAGPAHDLDLLGGLDLDPAVGPCRHGPTSIASGRSTELWLRHDWGTTSRASKIRFVTSLDLAHAVELDQDPALAVDLDQRLGLLGVELLPAPDDVLGVVGAALGLGALQQPLHQLLGVDGQHHGGVEAVAGEGDHAVELLDLRERARVAVEQEPRLGVGLVDPVADHLVGDLVGDVLAGVHVALGLDPQRRCPGTRWPGRCRRWRSRGCRSGRRRPAPGCPCRPRGGPS